MPERHQGREPPHQAGQAKSALHKFGKAKLRGQPRQQQKELLSSKISTILADPVFGLVLAVLVVACYSASVYLSGLIWK
jgi:hypothetical protein